MFPVYQPHRFCSGGCYRGLPSPSTAACPAKMAFTCPSWKREGLCHGDSRLCPKFKSHKHTVTFLINKMCSTVASRPRFKGTVRKMWRFLILEGAAASFQVRAASYSVKTPTPCVCTVSVWCCQQRAITQLSGAHGADGGCNLLSSLLVSWA